MSHRPLPALSRLFPGLFYGWIVALGTSVLSFVSVGVGFYSLTVFLDGLCAEHGWSRASVSAPSSLYFVVSGVTGLFVGRAIDRTSGRRWIVLGTLVMAGAVVCVGRIDSPWQLYPAYAAMAVGFAMCSSIPVSAIIARWFVTMRALAMSVSQTGVSIGGIVIVPLATALIAAEGIELATLVLAAILVAIALPMTVLVLRWDPREHGLEPDGERRPRADPLLAESWQQRPWRRRDALATPTFWGLAFAFGLMLFCQIGVLVHELAFLAERLGRQPAAWAVSATAAGSIVGRLAIGSFADRFRKKPLAVGLFLVQAAALLLFTLVPGRAPLYAVAFLFGSTIGNIFMMQSLISSDMFGVASFGSVFGMLQLFTQLFGGLGPLALGALFDALGAYEPGLRALAGLAAVAALLLAIVPTPRAPET
jgi:sugar phosphate permease